MNSNEDFVNNLSIKAEPGLVWENNNRHEEEINEEVFNPVLVENLDSNEKVRAEILAFVEYQQEKLNRKNLANYCGVLDPSSENDGCARVNSIYLAKFGKSHIKKTKIINPYGGFSQSYRQDALKAQKQKLSEFTNAYVKPLDELKKSNK